MEFGATHTYSSIEEATPAVERADLGRGADKTILTPGVMKGDIIGRRWASTSKGGTVVVTAIANMMDNDVTLSLFACMMNKELKGCLFGSGNPRFDIPALLSMYREGQLKLDELVTSTYTLDEINQGYQDMRDGKNIRGVITFVI